jgi:5-methylcytosine-specific restriction endonuclease McrA
LGQYVLVLNAGYEFLNISSLRKAIKLVYKGKAEIVEALPEREIRSTGRSFKMPSIIRMLYFIVRPFKQVPLNKKNVLLRDRHKCQYCGEPGSTVDHVVPSSKGGQASWENCVCACSYCNSKKKNRTPREAGMKLLQPPKKPKFISRMIIGAESLASGWEKYLFCNVEADSTGE